MYIQKIGICVTLKYTEFRLSPRSTNIRMVNERTTAAYANLRGYTASFTLKYSI